MRPFWIGLVAGVALVGLGIGVGVTIQRAQSPTHHVRPIATPAPAATSGSVRLSGAQSNAGWIVYVHLPERARAIEYRRGDGVWTALGPNPHDVDLATGEPRPKTYAMLSDLDGPTRFSVRYTADSGERRGPFELSFDPRAESIATLKSLLDDLPTWVELRDYEGQRLAYFTTLLVYKPAIAAIRYGVDTVDPDRSLRFAPSERLGIAASDQIFVRLPPGARELVVEVTLRDGTRLRERFPTTPTIP